MEQTSLYTEHAPKRVDRTKERVDKADEGIQTLTAEARKAQYDADQLALARLPLRRSALYTGRLPKQKALPARLELHTSEDRTALALLWFLSS